MDNSFEQNFDLRAILDEEEIAYAENHKHFFLEECPNCGKRHKLNIDKKTKMWICWSCVGSEDPKEAEVGKGNLYSLLLTLGFDELQVKKMFKGKKWHRYTDDFQFEKLEWQPYEDTEKSKSKEVTEVQIPQWLIYLDRTEEQIRRFPEVYNYLWSRYVRTKEQYQKFLLYYNPYRKRVVFPAITREYKCIGLQSRDITDRHKIKHPKCVNPECDMRYHYYFVGEEEAPEKCWCCDSQLELCEYQKSINTTNFAKTEFFFNEQNIDWNKPVVIVEGPFDAINVPNAMAFLGKFLSDTQFNILIEKNPPKIILYLDGDEAGDSSNKVIFNQLRPFFDIEIVFVEDGDDPGSHDTEYNLNKINTACKPYEWFTRKNLVYL